MNSARTQALSLFLSVTLLALPGCGSSSPARTGFLSDYSRLQAVSDTSYRYRGDPAQLAAYTSFIVDPVHIHHHADSGAQPSQEMRDLATYFRGAIIQAISDGYPVVDAPGPGVARVRIALTDVKKSEWWMNIHPGSKLTGAGTGEAAMEGEIVDSMTGEQLAALVESQRGSQFELDTFSAHDDARDAIDGWAARFRQRLDEVHGQ